MVNWWKHQITLRLLKDNKNVLTGCFPLPFSSAAYEKKIAFKDKRKVEFSIYGDTTLHSMLHAEKKKICMTGWSRRERIIFVSKARS